jgi:hypothetical protein
MKGCCQLNASRQNARLGPLLVVLTLSALSLTSGSSADTNFMKMNMGIKTEAVQLWRE